MTITINYLPSLGSFLDEKNIIWNGLSSDTIEIYIEDAEKAFQLGREYEQFMQEIETCED